MTKHFIALARVSSREQEREGFSLDIQEDALKREAERRNGMIVRLWRIAETASKKDERTTFKELVAFAKRHASDLDGILFYKIDRAARNLFDYVELERLESEFHVPFFSVTQPTENTPSGRMQRRMLASMASYYTEQQSLDVQEGVRRRVECGLFPQKAPYGYRNFRVDKRSLVEEHPENGPKVRKVFSLFVTEWLSLDQLRQRLHDDGVFYSDTRPFFPTATLYAILRSRAYLGEVRYQQRWLPGTHEPLVDQVTWDRVQRLLTGKVRPTHDLTFTGGLIHCKHCGRLVTGEKIIKKSSGKPYFYYRCSLYTAPGHPRVRLSEKNIDGQLAALFDRLKIDGEDQRAWCQRQGRDRTSDQREAEQRQAAEVARQLTLAHQRRNELLEMRLAGDISRDSFAAKDTDLLARQAQLQAKAEELSRKAKDKDESAEFDVLRCLRDAWAAVSRPAKRRIIRAAFARLELDGEAVVPSFLKPFDVLDRPATISVIAEDRDHHVPFGAPPWITPTDISEAIRVWQPRYGQPLTDEDALEIILNVRALLDAVTSVQ